MPVFEIKGQKLLWTGFAGARRGLLQLPGVEEDVGMVGIHYRGEFLEMVPWTGEVQA